MFLVCVVVLMCQANRGNIDMSIPEKATEMKPLKIQEGKNPRAVALSNIVTALLLFAFLLVSSIMNLMILTSYVNISHLLQETYYLFTAHVWKPVKSVDRTFGCILMLPLFHLLASFFLSIFFAIRHTNEYPRKTYRSLSYTVKGKVLILLSLLIWDIPLCIYYFIVPLPASIQGSEAIILTVVIVIVQVIASGVGGAAFNTEDSLDAHEHILFNVIIYTLPSMCSSMVLAINPHVKAVSIFVPLAAFFVDYLKFLLRHILIVKNVDVPIFIAKLLSYHKTPLANGNQQAISATIRLLCRIIDFTFYSGYSLVFAPLLLTIVLIDVVTFFIVAPYYTSSIKKATLTEIKLSVLPFILYVAVLGGGLFVSVPTKPNVVPLVTLVIIIVLMPGFLFSPKFRHLYLNVGFFSIALGVAIYAYLYSNTYTSRIPLISWLVCGLITFFVQLARPCFQST